MVAQIAPSRWLTPGEARHRPVVRVGRDSGTPLRRRRDESSVARRTTHDGDGAPCCCHAVAAGPDRLALVRSLPASPRRANDSLGVSSLNAANWAIAQTASSRWLTPEGGLRRERASGRSCESAKIVARRSVGVVTNRPQSNARRRRSAVPLYRCYCGTVLTRTGSLPALSGSSGAAVASGFFEA